MESTAVRGQAGDGIGGRLKTGLAERVGFEPTERFPVHSISSAASSTTPAPLREIRISNFEFRNFLWRRGWDSNPRWPLSHSGFRDRCTNPLCDLSAS